MIGNQTTQKQNLDVLLTSSILGVIRGVITLPLQHPLDAIKTNMQALSQQASTAIYHIYYNKGIRGFYNGFLANTTRIIVKQIYRWPLIIGITSFYRKKLKWSELKSSTIAGFTMALLEVGFITPCERLKCWLMTSTKNQKIRNFLFSKSFFTLFQGFNAVFIKQAFSWVSFLSSTTYFKEKFKQIYQTQQLTDFQIILVSIPVSFVNTFFVMPVDYIKTQYQKQTSQSKKELWLNLRRKYMEKGIKQFYIGWQMKIIQYTINSIFTVAVLESLMKDYQSRL